MHKGAHLNNVLLALSRQRKLKTSIQYIINSPALAARSTAGRNSDVRVLLEVVWPCAKPPMTLLFKFYSFIQERSRLQEGTLLQEKAPTTRQAPNDLAV